MDTTTKLVRLCVLCAEPDTRAGKLCYGTDVVGKHAFVEREPCRDCGGAGGLRQGRDPQTDETCPTCHGVGVEGIV